MRLVRSPEDDLPPKAHRPGPQPMKDMAPGGFDQTIPMASNLSPCLRRQLLEDRMHGAGEKFHPTERIVRRLGVEHSYAVRGEGKGRTFNVVKGPEKTLHPRR